MNSDLLNCAPIKVFFAKSLRTYIFDLCTKLIILKLQLHCYFICPSCCGFGQASRIARGTRQAGGILHGTRQVGGMVRGRWYCTRKGLFV